MNKPAKIVKKDRGTRWELRAGYGGRGKVLWTAVGVIPNQLKSIEHASVVLEEAAERQGYTIINEYVKD